ncbi:MAG: copper chaperone PCu(A)C [Candidatus Eiseniibacteriota bacterium]
MSTPNMWNSLAALVLLAGSLGASGASPAGAANSPEPGIRDAWARSTPAGAKYGAIYATFESAAGDRLLGASVPHSLAGATQIHETVTSNDGQMMMRQVAGVDLPTGQVVEFKPGGFHIMLMNLKKPMKSGEHVNVTLTFKHAGQRTVVATVRDE